MRCLLFTEANMMLVIHFCPAEATITRSVTLCAGQRLRKVLGTSSQAAHVMKFASRFVCTVHAVRKSGDELLCM